MADRISRRTVLAAGGALGAAGVVAACGSSSGSASSSAAPTTASPTGPSPLPSPTGGGTPIAKAADIPVAGGVVFEDRGIVVTQPSPGTFAAFTATCPHQGCVVNEVRDNQIVCPCHMSLFSASTGAVEQGPATKGLAAIPITESGGDLLVN